MIDCIQVEGYRSIKAQKVELRPMNILLGSNGVGKSNFLSVFEFFRKVIQSRDWEYSPESSATRTLYMGRQMTDKVRLHFHYSGEWLESLEFELKDVENSLRVRSSSVVEVHPEEEKGNGENLRALVEQYWVHHFPDTGEKSRFRMPSTLTDNRFLRADGSNLASVLYRIRVKDASLFRKIEDYVKELIPSFGCFDLNPSPIDESEIHLQWHPKGMDVPFDERHLSDGSLRMISLVTLLLQPVLPNLILVDEPEIGLHPAAIAIIADLLKKAAEKTQLIVATQSIDLINHFSPEDIMVCDYKDNQTRIKRIGTDELQVWLDEYSLGEIWEKNIFGGQPY